MVTRGLNADERMALILLGDGHGVVVSSIEKPPGESGLQAEGEWSVRRRGDEAGAI
jgi:hypothetical protein